MNNITGLTHLIMDNMNSVNRMNRNLLKSEEDSNDSLFYCITPDRVVLSASSISYETETENVIVETIDGALIWFCMPREEYDAQLERFKKTGVFDFMNKLDGTTEEKLRSMKQVKPVSIRKEERKFVCSIFSIFFAIVGILLLLTVIFWMFWNFVE